MEWLTLLLLIHHTLAQNLEKEKCVIDHRPSENISERKLIHDLVKCGYDSFKPPVPNGTEPLKVNAYFVMKSFKFDSKLQEFSTFTWTVFSWEDERLKWDPAKYGGITSVVATTLKTLWAPSIMLINSIGQDFDQRYRFISCELRSSGTVQCIGRIVYKAKCSTDLRDWPFDAQYCNLEFGIYSEVATKMQLNASPRALRMIGAETGADWDIMVYQQINNKTSEKPLVIKFRLERHAEVLAAIVIYPSLILSILTFSSLFLNARFNLRLLVICFSLFCHIYFITDLSFEISENTKDPPRLLMYYRGSFILTGVHLFVSFVLNALCRRDVQVCPNWVTSINDFVFVKFGRFVIWPRWETNLKEDLNARNFVKDWTDFANVANTFSFFTSIIVYISLYCVFMPHPIIFTKKLE